MKTLEQQRASNALARVAALGAQNADSETFKKSYRSYVDRLCPAVIMNGLGQALATERAAAGSTSSPDKSRAHQELYLSVQQWLCRAVDGVYPAQADLLEAIVNHNEPQYLHAQAEALAWLTWHKKFCRAAFPRGEDNE